MNTATITGRLTKDPELKYTQSGKAVATFTVAVNGYKKDDTDFIPVVVWDKLAENCGRYIAKGSKALVSGRINTRSYDAKDGTKRYITEIVAREVEFLDSKKAEPQTEHEGFTEVVDEEELPF